jgi:uncharacterized protein (TIGR02466 family)
MKVSSLFSVDYSVINLKNSLDLEEIVYILESEYKHQLKNSFGTCFTTHASERGGFILDDEKFSLLRKFIEKTIKEYSKMKNFGNLQIQDSWWNHYNLGGYTLPHNHPGSIISGAFYVSGCSNQNNIAFFNPISGENIISNNSFNVYEPKDGDLILFPSYLLHTTTPSTTENRNVISFNTMYE